MVNSGHHYSYDEVPYPNLCYAQTHPSRLEVLGKLLGMSPAPVEQCRVLEIGCAAGSNLLPMAALLPNSTFVGIDNSGVQIQEAQATVDAVGLSNIRFQEMDILDITPDFGIFDYIIAHGIYSWVPPEVRDKLLAVCKQNLAPQGIVYVSYNTFPGWHTLQIIRNMMLYRTRDAENPAEKSAQAREWITFMAHALSENSDSAYAALFENYLAFRITQTTEIDHAALLHDEMEAYNNPVYFHEFAAHAEQHDLQYLVESDFPTVMPNGLKPEVIEHLGKTARTTIEMEQYMDYLRNRTFRRTLLCHADVDVNRRLVTDPIREFYITSAAHSVAVDDESARRGIERFEGSDGSVFSTDHPLTKAAFHYLIEASPHRIRFDVLLQKVSLHPGMAAPNANDIAGLAANLLRAFSYSLNLIEFHSFAPPLAHELSERPVTTALLRHQARQGGEVGSLLHQRVALEGLSRIILLNLDGQNDRDTLIDFMTKLAESGKIGVQDSGQVVPVGDDARALMAAELERTLHSLADWGLLVG